MIGKICKSPDGKIGQITAPKCFNYPSNGVKLWHVIWFDGTTGDIDGEPEIIANSVNEYWTKRAVTPHQMVEYLNEVLDIDTRAINDLLNHRVPANQKLIEHPTVAVNDEDQVGLLGILNGVFSPINTIYSLTDEQTGQCLQFMVDEFECLEVEETELDDRSDWDRPITG